MIDPYDADTHCPVVGHRLALESVDELAQAFVRGLFLARQTAASLRAGQPEYAADRMLSLARVMPLVHSAQLNDMVRDVLSASRPWHTVPEVRTARAQLLDVWPDAQPKQR